MIFMDVHNHRISQIFEMDIHTVSIEHESAMSPHPHVPAHCSTTGENTARGKNLLERTEYKRACGIAVCCLSLKISH